MPAFNAGDNARMCLTTTQFTLQGCSLPLRKQVEAQGAHHHRAKKIHNDDHASTCAAHACFRL
jgi:hypothetical protein